MDNIHNVDQSALFYIDGHCIIIEFTLQPGYSEEVERPWHNCFENCELEWCHCCDTQGARLFYWTSWVSIIIEAGIKQRMDLHTVVPSWYANWIDPNQWLPNQQVLLR